MGLESNRKIFLCASDKKRMENEDFILNLKKEFNINSFPSKELKEGDIVVAIGGDGTLNFLANNLNNLKNLKVLYFAQGTANDFAKSLSISPIVPTVELVKNIISNAPDIKVPLMKCNDKKFLNVATAGAPAKVTESGSDLIKEYTGKVSYYLSALDEILNAEKMKFTYSIPSREKNEAESFGFIVSQGNFAGGGVRVSTSYSPCFQDNFNFVTIDSTDVSACIAPIVKLQNNYPFDFDEKDKTILSHSVDKLEVSSDDEILIKLDGEEYSAKKINFSKSESSFNFYVY